MRIKCKTCGIQLKPGERYASGKEHDVLRIPVNWWCPKCFRQIAVSFQGSEIARFVFCKIDLRTVNSWEEALKLTLVKKEGEK